ncbi:MAG: macro domain-containing protein [Planctomycetia bacterium]
MRLRRGDVVQEAVDAVVNAANSNLWAGSGVCGAIHRAAGPEIAEECAVWVAGHGECKVGGAMLTTGGWLPAAHVIHAVGPIYDDYPPAQADELLAAAYRSILHLAGEQRFRSLAIPSLSTGAYGFPINRAAPIALETVRARLTEAGSEGALVDVRFVLFSDEDYAVYERALAGLPNPPPSQP